MSRVYRDGTSHSLDKGSKIFVRTTSDGHTIESWRSEGKRVYFANLANSVYCAHGDTSAQAIGNAIWKDPKLRPPLEDLVAEIKPQIKTRKITVREFRLLTGACETGCRDFLVARGMNMSASMTLDEFIPVGGDWARKLKEVLS